MKPPYTVLITPGRGNYNCALCPWHLLLEFALSKNGIFFACPLSSQGVQPTATLQFYPLMTHNLNIVTVILMILIVLVKSGIRRCWHLLGCRDELLTDGLF